MNMIKNPMSMLVDSMMKLDLILDELILFELILKGLSVEESDGVELAVGLEL